jgi:hypothetical protein
LTLTFFFFFFFFFFLTAGTEEAHRGDVSSELDVVTEGEFLYFYLLLLLLLLLCDCRFRGGVSR